MTDKSVGSEERSALPRVRLSFLLRQTRGGVYGRCRHDVMEEPNPPVQLLEAEVMPVPEHAALFEPLPRRPLPSSFPPSTSTLKFKAIPARVR